MRMQNPVDIRESRTRDHPLHVDASVLFDQGGRKGVFVRVARRKVDVSAFRCTRHQAPTDAGQQCDAESGARGNQRDAAFRVDVPLMENVIA